MARLVYARAALIAGLATIVAAIWIAPRLWARTTDFDRELKRLAVEIASMPEGSTPEASTRRAFRLYQRATLTNRPGDFSETSGAVARALADKRSDIDLALLNAALDFRVHRLAATRRDLAPIPAGDADAELMRADVDLQDGLYDDARERYEAVVRRAPTSSMWSALARLAFLTAARGDTDGGDRLYAQAEDDLTAKDMRAYAWVEVQRGWTQFSRGRYDEAASHYRLAGRAYSGYWLVDEYTAELLGAEREFDEAIALYEQAIARAPRPDLYQQLGDLSMVARKPREAKQWDWQRLFPGRPAARCQEPPAWRHQSPSKRCRSSSPRKARLPAA